MRPVDGSREDQAALNVYGTWDGATVTLTASTEAGGTFSPIRDAYGTQVGVFTEDTFTNIDSSKVARGKLTVTNAGGSTSLTAIFEEG